MFVFFYLGCYRSVAFKIDIQISYNFWTKPLTHVKLIYEQFIYVLYLDLVVYISFVMNKFWLIDWLIDWLILIDWLMRIIVSRYKEGKVASRSEWDRCTCWCYVSLPYVLGEFLKKWAYGFMENCVINIDLICIYCNLSNWRVAMVYWSSPEIHRFEPSSNQGHHVLLKDI